MQKPKVDVAIFSFCYGGNGGISSTIPELCEWTTRTVIKMKGDPRIGRIEPIKLSDTPITMTRNRAVKIARERGYDMILMLDSDNEPDGYLGVDPEATPFWDTAFDFAYDRLVKGIPTCIAAPYCGPPPHPVEKEGIFDGGEVPYLFQWSNRESHDPHAPNKLDIMSRAEAAKLRGIFPVAALPTGCCLFTTNCFDGPPKPYFKYEWMDEDHSEKASTEDVYATRNISLYWSMTKGIDVCFATCDSWALHYKPKKVGKPYIVPVEAVAKNMRDAVLNNYSIKEKMQNVDFTEELKRGGTVGPQRITPSSVSQIQAQIKQSAPAVDVTKLKRRWDVLGPEDDQIYVSDEEWEDLLTLKRMEEEIKPAEPVVLAEAEFAPIAEAVAVALEEEPHKSNGKGIRHKMIGGRKVAIIDYELTDESIENVQALAGWLSNKMGSPIEAAVFHAGTGQGTAAIIDATPAFSRVFAFDSRSQYSLSQEYATQFEKAFEKEIESGKVKADVDSRAFPEVKGYSVDLVFIENFVTTSKLTAGAKLVAPAGLLCGTGYGSPDTKALVDAFATKYEWKVQVSGDIWAIPVGDIANAR